MNDPAAERDMNAVGEISKILSKSNVGISVIVPAGSDTPIIYDNIGGIPSVQMYYLTRAVGIAGWKFYKEMNPDLKEWEEVVDNLVDMLKSNMMRIVDSSKDENKEDDNHAETAGDGL